MIDEDIFQQYRDARQEMQTVIDNGGSQAGIKMYEDTLKSLWSHLTAMERKAIEERFPQGLEPWQNLGT